MIPVGITTYKKSTRKSTIDLIFATPLLSESFIRCDIARTFDHDLDHQFILSQWIMWTISNPPSSRFLLSKLNISLIKSMLKKKFAKNSPNLCTIPKQLDALVNFLVSVINTAMDSAILKAEPSTKSVLGFDEKCKEVQIKARTLKKN